MYSSTISLLTRLLNVSDDKALYYFNHLMAFSTLIRTLAFVRDCLHTFLCCQSTITQETQNCQKTYLLSKQILGIVVFVSKNSLAWFQLIQYPTLLYSEPITAVAGKSW